MAILFQLYFLIFELSNKGYIKFGLEFLYLTSMKIKTYISIFLVLIMVGKLFALDSNILGEIANTSEISYVKKKCDSNSHKQSGDFQFNQVHEGIQITFLSFCNSVFQLEEPVDEKNIIQLSFKCDFWHIVADTKEYSYKFIPPPKLS